MSQLTLVRQIEAPADILFQALITAEGMAAWWGPDQGPVLVAESDPRAGGKYRVRFKMENGEVHEATGEFLVLEPPHRVAMSFRWVGSEDNFGPSQIEMKLRAIDENTTELTFTHLELPDEEQRQSHEHGWSGSLSKLDKHFQAKR